MVHRQIDIFRGRAVRCRLVAATMAGAAALMLAPAAAQASVTLQCMHADGSTGRLSTAYSTDTSRPQVEKQFDADLELTPGKYKARQRVRFIVAGVQVGTRVLKRDGNGDLEADLKLTTTKTKGKMAWPANFPNVKQGTTVVTRIGRAKVLSCTY